MKIFVSGSIREKGRIREVYAALIAAGHVITHDWTQTDAMPTSYADAPGEAAIRAQKDIDGVLAADAYIIVTDNELPGKGMYVELGAALALASLRSQGFPVLLLGPMYHESIFYYHPSILRFENFAEVLSWLDAHRGILNAA